MKNRRYKIFSVLSLIVVGVVGSSCLKDDYTDFSKVGTVIEFLDALPGAATALSFEPKDTPDSLWVRINATGPNAPTSDITVTVGLSPEGLTTYNEDDGHVVGTQLPDSAYSIPNTSVTIVAGKDALGNPNRTAELLVLLYSKKIPATLGVNYVLSLGLISAPEGTVISGNFGAVLFNFYHNVYDGNYHRFGTRYNFSSAADFAGWDNATNAPKAGSTIASISAPWDYPSEPVLTVNATTSIVEIGNSNGGFGTINIVIDPATNKVTKLISTPDTGLNAVSFTPGTQSYYDPATKTIYLWYVYQNVDADTGAPTTFRAIKDVMVKL